MVGRKRGERGAEKTMERGRCLSLLAKAQQPLSRNPLLQDIQAIILHSGHYRTKPLKVLKQTLH